MDKPDVDFIEGLSPAVSIDQKSTNRNPRSTVGTITEVYDYLRLLLQERVSLTVQNVEKRLPSKLHKTSWIRYCKWKKD
jgi:excinuclease UvrABC ATPase subunit